MLDLSQFASLEDALVKVEPGDRYRDLGRELMAVATEFEPNAIMMFWFSMVARGQALHSAIAREAREENPSRRFPACPAPSVSVRLAAGRRRDSVIGSGLMVLQPRGAPARCDSQTLTQDRNTHTDKGGVRNGGRHGPNRVGPSRRAAPGRAMLVRKLRVPRVGNVCSPV